MTLTAHKNNDGATLQLDAPTPTTGCSDLIFYEHHETKKDIKSTKKTINIKYTKWKPNLNQEFESRIAHSLIEISDLINFLNINCWWAINTTKISGGFRFVIVVNMLRLRRLCLGVDR